MSGAELSEFNGIRPGDLITAYEKGFHRCLKILDRSDELFVTSDGVIYPSPLVVYERVYSQTGKPVSRNPNPLSCCITWCRKVDQTYLDQLTDEFQLTIDRVKNVMADFYG